MAWDRELHELEREASALEKQIQAGTYVHPEEIWELVQRYIDMGETFRANRLAEHLPDREDW